MRPRLRRADRLPRLDPGSIVNRGSSSTRKLKKDRMLAIVTGYDGRNTMLESKTVTIR
jgi:hypothetical protein